MEELFYKYKNSGSHETKTYLKDIKDKISYIPKEIRD